MFVGKIARNILFFPWAEKSLKRAIKVQVFIETYAGHFS